MFKPYRMCLAADSGDAQSSGALPEAVQIRLLEPLISRREAMSQQNATTEMACAACMKDTDGTTSLLQSSTVEERK